MALSTAGAVELRLTQGVCKGPEAAVNVAHDGVASPSVSSECSYPL